MTLGNGSPIFPESDSVGFSLCELTARAAMSVPVDRHPYLPKGARILPYSPKGVRITQKQHALGPLWDGAGGVGFQSSNSILGLFGSTHAADVKRIGRLKRAIR